MTHRLHFVPCGDRALLAYLGTEIDPAVNRAVQGLSRALRALNHPAIVEITPGYHALLIEYDPIRIRVETLEELALAALAGLEDLADSGRTVEVPVLYGGEMGPDLDAVAAHASLSPDEVVRRHAEAAYRVYCLGFSPGFAYLGGLDPAIHTPRLAEPRTRVPGGSVGIGGNQTGVYPSPSPAGWHLIGRSPMDLFDPWRQPPTPFEPGDTVRFQPITPERYAALTAPAVLRHPPFPEFAPGKTGLRIITPGLATTVQDLGRRGYMAYGVPVAGAADFWSLMVGNWLLSNRARTPGLELTLMGPELEFTGPVAFCLTGAPMPAELIPAGGGSPVPVPGWTALLAGPGDRLRMGTTTEGCRSYLCVAGGFDLEPVLGSFSEDLFAKLGPFGRPLQSGDWLPTGLPLHPPADLAGRAVPMDVLPRFGDRGPIRITRGPQVSAFTEAAFTTLFSAQYTVGPNSDRQGLRLQGPALAHTQRADILSEPIPAGSIQVPANGQPILLLGNRQTVGGYTKIGVAVYADVAAAAQLRPGDRLRFQEVDAAEAHSIAWAERRRLAQIRRDLERAMGTVAQSGHVFTIPAEIPVTIAAPQPQPEPTLSADPTREQPAPPPRTRTFRITVADITFEACVEEVDE